MLRALRVRVQPGGARLPTGGGWLRCFCSAEAEPPPSGRSRGCWGEGGGCWGEAGGSRSPGGGCWGEAGLGGAMVSLEEDQEEESSVWDWNRLFSSSGVKSPFA